MSRDQERSAPPRPSRPERQDSGGAREVRDYLVKLVALILVGLCLMTGAAVIAWQLYGGKLDQERGPARDLAPRPMPGPSHP